MKRLQERALAWGNLRPQQALRSAELRLQVDHNILYPLVVLRQELGKKEEPGVKPIYNDCKNKAEA